MVDLSENFSEKPVVARFAPSPTGISHAGNIYTYLMTWLLARKSGGKIILRIEDLDSSRSKPEYVDSLLTMLEETGLSYDLGPYYQSNNKDIYARAYEGLSDKGLTYPCFCTRRDLSFQSAPHESDNIKVYNRRCLNLSNQEIADRTSLLAREGRKPAYRLLTDSRKIDFNDLVFGKQSVILDKDLGDFIIKRADDDFAYHLAVVIDDIEEGVNLVSRGYDLLACTPQQIYLYQLLGVEPPTYAHFPLLCAKDGRRLAKRDVSATYDSLKDTLGSPEHVIGHIAHVSGIKDDDEPTTPEELLGAFDLSTLNDRYKDTNSIIFE